jgi:NADPH2:quinone reductase
MTAYQLLTRCAHVKSGERILIHGASGGAGTAVVQLGHLMGLKVYGTCSAAKMDHVRKLGGIPIDYKNQDFVDVITTKLEDGPGVDAVFDPIGGEHFKRSYKCLRDGFVRSLTRNPTPPSLLRLGSQARAMCDNRGRFVAFGMQTMANGESTSLMSSLANYAMIKMWPFDHHGPSSLYSIDDMRKSHPERFAEDLSHLCNLVLRKELDPVVSAVLPLEQAVEAMRMIDDGRVIGKVVLKVH